MIWLVFGLNLGLTVLIEGLLMLLLFRRRDYIYYSLLCNLLTNPALNLLLALAVWGLGPAAYWPALIALELVALALEALVYARLCDFSAKKALGLSLLLNAASYFSGWLLWQWLGPVLAKT